MAKLPRHGAVGGSGARVEQVEVVGELSAYLPGPLGADVRIVDEETHPEGQRPLGPMVEIHEANLFLVVSATMGGGVFGDHCSPISDTTVMSSIAAACDHIDHVKTQLPYALAAGGVAAVAFAVAGAIA